jgi:hypothetical protein
VASGSWPTLQLLLRWSAAHGGCLPLDSPGLHGITPLHLLVAAPNAATLMQGLLQHHPEAVASAWHTQLAADGCSPAQHAQQKGRRVLNHLVSAATASVPGSQEGEEEVPAPEPALAPEPAPAPEPAAAAPAPRQEPELLEQAAEPPSPSPQPAHPELPWGTDEREAAALEKPWRLQQAAAAAGSSSAHLQREMGAKLLKGRCAGEGESFLVADPGVAAVLLLFSLVQLAVGLGLTGWALGQCMPASGPRWLWGLDLVAGAAAAAAAVAMAGVGAAVAAIGKCMDPPQRLVLWRGLPPSVNSAAFAVLFMALALLAARLAALGKPFLPRPLAGTARLGGWLMGLVAVMVGAAPGAAPLLPPGHSLAAVLGMYCSRVLCTMLLAAPALLCCLRSRHGVGGQQPGWTAASLVLLLLLSAVGAATSTHHMFVMAGLSFCHLLPPEGQRHFLQRVTALHMAVTVIMSLASGQAMLPLVLSECAVLASASGLLAGLVRSGWVRPLAH